MKCKVGHGSKSSGKQHLPCPPPPPFESPPSNVVTAGRQGKGRLGTARCLWAPLPPTQAPLPSAAPTPPQTCGARPSPPQGHPRMPKPVRAEGGQRAHHRTRGRSCPSRAGHRGPCNNRAKGPCEHRIRGAALSIAPPPPTPGTVPPQRRSPTQPPGGTPPPPLGLQRSGVAPPLCSSRACLPTAFIAFSVHGPRTSPPPPPSVGEGHA